MDYDRRASEQSLQQELAEIRWKVETLRAEHRGTGPAVSLLNSAAKHIGDAMDALNKFDAMKAQPGSR